LVGVVLKMKAGTFDGILLRTCKVLQPLNTVTSIEECRLLRVSAAYYFDEVCVLIPS